MNELSNEQLIAFARAVIDILTSSPDWGSDELGDIAEAASREGISVVSDEAFR